MSNEPDWEAMAKELLGVLKAVNYEIGTPSRGSVYALNRIMPKVSAAITRTQSLMEKKS